MAKVYFPMRIEEWLLKGLEDIATADRRSTAALIHNILEDYYKSAEQVEPTLPERPTHDQFQGYVDWLESIYQAVKSQIKDYYEGPLPTRTRTMFNVWVARNAGNHAAKRSIAQWEELKKIHQIFKDGPYYELRFAVEIRKACQADAESKKPATAAPEEPHNPPAVSLERPSDQSSAEEQAPEAQPIKIRLPLPMTAVPPLEVPAAPTSQPIKVHVPHPSEPVKSPTQMLADLQAKSKPR